jgi:hypothetical protein
MAPPPFIFSTASARTDTPAAPRPPSPDQPLKYKDCAGIVPVVSPLPTRSALEAALLGPGARGCPRDGGRVDAVVQRPAPNAREVVPRAWVTVDGGMKGSGWVRSEAKGYTDQICVMSSAAIRGIVGDEAGVEAWAPAGDQVFMDFDLGEGNLAIGDLVRVGGEEGVLLEVTKKPHLGCMKFVARYGADALKVCNSQEGRARRLRGIYFRALCDGWIAVGDRIVKVPRGEAA